MANETRKPDQSTESDLTRRLEKAVRSAKERREWSVEYMTLYEMRQMDREEGRKEGLEEGRKEGIQEGQIKELIEMVKSGLTPYDMAVKRAGQKYHIKEADFRKMLDAYQADGK